MTIELQVNRYGATVPTYINPLGTSISTPFYLSPSFEARKALLNAFRTIKTKQLIEMGYSNTEKKSLITVVDSSTAPMTPIEQELGQNEDTLRMVLFQKGGIQDRVILKLQAMTGVEVISKEEIEATFQSWLSHLFTDYTNGHQDTSPTIKATRKPSKRKETQTSSSAK